jgi:hypothetical protein
MRLTALPRILVYKDDIIVHGPAIWEYGSPLEETEHSCEVVVLLSFSKASPFSPGHRLYARFRAVDVSSGFDVSPEKQDSLKYHCHEQ